MRSKSAVKDQERSSSVIGVDELLTRVCTSSRMLTREIESISLQSEVSVFLGACELLRDLSEWELTWKE